MFTFEHFINQRILKNKMHHGFPKKHELFSTLLIIRSVFWVLNPHIRVISDTEDWSNDDKFSFDHRNKLHFTTYPHRKQQIQIVKNISQYYSFYCIFDQINAATVSRIEKSDRPQTSEQYCIINAKSASKSRRTQAVSTNHPSQKL